TQYLQGFGNPEEYDNSESTATATATPVDGEAPYEIEEGLLPETERQIIENKPTRIGP
ncbi:hypothetical protein BGZ65_008121, partial [Modicella reniformis]